MPRNEALEALMPLEKCPLQPYFSNSIQLAELIDWVLGQIGRAGMCISTFSTGEEFLRRLYRLKERGNLRYCRLFCDLRAARKTVTLRRFIESTFDEVYLCENHSKVVLLYAGSRRVAIVTSQNQTRGDRYEAGIITTDRGTFDRLEQALNLMAEKSISLHDLDFNS